MLGLLGSFLCVAGWVSRVIRPLGRESSEQEYRNIHFARFLSAESLWPREPGLHMNTHAHSYIYITIRAHRNTELRDIPLGGELLGLLEGGF